MFIFSPIQYFILGCSGAILFAYQNHYKSPLVYSTGLRNYLVTVSFGFAAVGSALGLQIILQAIGISENVFNNAFFYSALIEELVKLLFILLVLWFNRTTEVLYDGIFYGIVLGGTFGFIENMIYSTVLPFWPMMQRTITSSTLHLLNGGVAGYYCMKFLFTKENYKYKYLFGGFILCYISHGIYNYAGFTGGVYLMILSPLLVYNFILVEFISAYARSSLPKFTLDLIQLSVQDYELIRTYIKYELWLYNEQKIEKKYIDLFQSVEFKRRILIFCTVLIGFGFIALHVFFPELRKSFFKEIQVYEYISIFIIYPFVIAISIFFAGLVNPEFFQKQVFRVPLICVLDARNNTFQETTVVFYLTTYGFYAPFISPEKLTGELDLRFLIGSKEFKNIRGKATWINSNKNDIASAKSRFSVSGALIRFNGYPLSLIFYWHWARWNNRLTNFFKSFTNSEKM
jgi:protease PrsW